MDGLSILHTEAVANEELSVVVQSMLWSPLVPSWVSAPVPSCKPGDALQKGCGQQEEPKISAVTRETNRVLP